ncbi:YfhO family protein [bacterium]|nr:YfhO family protein [bacterium]
MPKVNAAVRSKPAKPDKLTISSWQKDVLAIVFLYLLTLIMFSDYVLQGKVFSAGGDVSTGTSITKAAKELTEKEGSMPLWFPYMFSGMPSFASGMYGDHSDIPVVKYERFLSPLYYINVVANFAFFNRDNSWEIATFFFAGLFMFLLARRLGFGYLIALSAAVAYMFCNFFVASMAAGHGGKVKTIAYIPLVVWSVTRFFNNRSLLNWAVMGYVMGIFFLDPGHTQILYYGFMTIGIYFIYFAIEYFKSDRIGILKNGTGLASAMAIGLCFGALSYFSQYVYSDVTMRSVAPAFAEAGEVAAGSGMTFEYITNWSFHPLESITFFIPTFFGLESPLYWGWMTFTSSAFYFGLLPMIAAIIAVVYRRNMITKWLLTVAIVSLLISFGRYFEPFFKLVLTILPFFDKFRVPSMILSIFIFNPTEEERKKRNDLARVFLYLLVGAAVVMIVSLLFKNAFIDMFSLLADGDIKRYNAQQIAQLKQLRFDLLSGGIFRFSAFAIVITGIIYLYLRQKISAGVSLAVLLVTLYVDVLILNKKILRPQNKASLTSEFQETSAVKFLKADMTHFRIFSLNEHAQSGSPIWNYFGIQSIGGYSPAKMRIYQDIIDFALYKGSDPQFPINFNITKMLNVKYFIANGQLPQDKGFKLVHMDQQSKNLVYEYAGFLPRAFFVNQAILTSNKQQIFDYLNSPGFDPAVSAIVEKKVAAEIQSPDSTRIDFAEYRTDYISMNIYTDKPSLMVLSEIYYPHGWKAFIDGRETEIYKTNYVLRSVTLPAGEHKIEFKFEPQEFSLGIWVSALSFYSVTGLMIVLTAIKFARSRNQAKTSA